MDSSVRVTLTQHCHPTQGQMTAQHEDDRRKSANLHRNRQMASLRSTLYYILQSRLFRERVVRTAASSCSSLKQSAFTPSLGFALRPFPFYHQRILECDPHYAPIFRWAARRSGSSMNPTAQNDQHPNVAFDPLPSWTNILSLLSPA